VSHTEYLQSDVARSYFVNSNGNKLYKNEKK